MTDQNRQIFSEKELEEQAKQRDRREQRMMWIFSASIIVLIAGAMGANMLFHHATPATSADTEMSAQSRTAPAQ